MDKVCSKCGKLKNSTCFTKQDACRDGLRPHCKTCVAQYNKQYNKLNQSNILPRKQKWNRRNRAKLRGYLRNYISNQRAQNPYYAIRHRIEVRIAEALKFASSRKSTKTAELLGCSISDYKKYLESKFLPTMSWTNRQLWHIDHIKPCSSFDLKDLQQQKICFHFTNTCPIWKSDNLQKGNR